MFACGYLVWEHARYRLMSAMFCYNIGRITIMPHPCTWTSLCFYFNVVPPSQLMSLVFSFNVFYLCACVLCILVVSYDYFVIVLR